MVVNHKGRLCYATTALAQLLGYPLKTLCAMDMASLVPPPYAQLHAGFLKACWGGVARACCLRSLCNAR